MSKRITLEEARRKQQHEKEILEKLKNGTYHSNRFSLRLKKRAENDKRWFDYIKKRGGIKEEKKESEKNATSVQQAEEGKTTEEQRVEMQK